ncbi:hypothetical protein EX30DRAFT_317833 [Ascodesmis nigricans]|uniref:Microbial-type PARG catalytic domain-containing protein n=1 Tax=Ascodesmis nigricans TaxID=341454 RepID=A0A4S2N058_9PEZI|nr:hypothetical protein EX30DRAFT_317833 [Ascodesmis nigricans]
MSAPIPIASPKVGPSPELALQTKRIIPSILFTTPAHTLSEYFNATHETTGLFRLGPRVANFPNLPPTTVRVINSDTFNAAISLLSQNPTKRVCVLNLANQFQPGGGWLAGAWAQEEQLCYRSTLSSALSTQYYPMQDVAAIYSPAVAIFRTAAPEYKLYSEFTPPRAPEIVSVITMAAKVCRPWDVDASGTGYKDPRDRKLMVEKIRMILRISGRKGERRLVLGALGCGAFGNPPLAIAGIWKEVLREDEFAGWWEEVVFAVYVPKKWDERALANLNVFTQVLDGLRLGG